MNNLQWPDIFTGELTVAQRIAQGATRNQGLARLCADGLCAWGNCMAGAKPLPPRFGEVMVEIGQAIGVAAYPPENLSKRADELLGR